MDTPKKQFDTIDEYIAAFPDDVQDVLQQLRQSIHEAAPEAIESISYQIPTFKLHGNLIHFAAYKNHYGMYPVPSATGTFAQELSPYLAAKGTIRFPKDQPIPYDLVTRIVQQRVKDMLGRQRNKKR